MKKLFTVLFLCSICFVIAKDQVIQKPYNKEKIRNQGRLKEFVKHSVSFEKQHPFTWSEQALDILIPIVEKDLEILPFTVQYARKNILHPIKNVYIVAPESIKIREYAETMNCIFVEEGTVLPFSMRDIDYFPKNTDRRGWLFQQLLKLSADHICESENILILDADTLFMRPQSFFHKDQVIFNCSEERHIPYRVMYQKLIQEEATGFYSFVAHSMLFQKKKLQELKAYIEKLHGKAWYEAILDLINKNDLSGFSEYETYGQFVSSRYSESTIHLYFFNLGLNREKHLKNVIENKFSLGKMIKTCSFHSWLDK